MRRSRQEPATGANGIQGGLRRTSLLRTNFSSWRIHLSRPVSTLSIRCGTFRLRGVRLILARNREPYKVVHVDKNSLPILQDGLENTVSIYEEILRTMSWGRCKEGKDSTIRRARLGTDSEKSRNEADKGTENMYVVDKLCAAST